jgi:TRAP-type C4-dicarboxylate transport system permease small subunit
MKLEKVLSIVLWVLLAVSAVLIVSMMTNISENEADPTMGAWINTTLTWSYILLGIGAVIAIVFALKNTFTDKEAGKKGLITLVFGAVVVVISYALASDAIPQFFGVEKFVEDGTLTNSVSKWIGTTLIASYVLLGLSVVAIAASAVTRVFK